MIPSGAVPTLMGVPRVPLVLMLSTWLELVLVNQTWPFGWAVIPSGMFPPVPAEGNANSWRVVSSRRDSNGSTPGRRPFASLIRLSRRDAQDVEPTRR